LDLKHALGKDMSASIFVGFAGLFLASTWIMHKYSRKRLTLLRVGVVGFSKTSFAEVERARLILRETFQGLYNDVGRKYSHVEIVSGWTALGVPLLAYEEASKFGFTTVGVACKRAQEHACFPCEKVTIVGENWGDESATFLDSCDTLLKLGGGPQSEAEYRQFMGPKKELML